MDVVLCHVCGCTRLCVRVDVRGSVCVRACVRACCVDILPRRYVSGQDPHSYATAHFAYWGLTAPERYAQEYRNQSCIVSGESGAGKTVACKMVMAYVNNVHVVPALCV